ncbi:MAG: putative transporter [Bacteroidales bacterium]|nr:putative transporter [Bacteroidales bacterium]
MESIAELFTGTGTAHSILILAFIIASGLWLSRFKIKGISIGTTWILFAGIVVGHFGFKLDPSILQFVKDFGLILFVFSIGLQVGPGFFHSFKKSGLAMNLLAAAMVVLGVLVTCAIFWLGGDDLTTLTGVMSGAITNTPGLGAAQQTLADLTIAEGSSAQAVAEASARMASAYALAYPLGVLGVIAVILITKPLFKVNIDKERREVESGDAQDAACRIGCEVVNPAVYGKSIREVLSDAGCDFVISRIKRDGEVIIPESDTALAKGDRLIVIADAGSAEKAQIIFGSRFEVNMADWARKDGSVISRRLSITQSKMTGKKLRELDVRNQYHVTVTRVLRSGIELKASPNLLLQVGDTIQVVGSPDGINELSRIVGNKPETLSKPNLVPIFFGIFFGVILGVLPLRFPSIPQPVKLGLAGGPLIVAILLGYFGPKWKITTYTTLSANMMLREIGISLFMAAVGVGASGTFVSSLVGGGWVWIFYGLLITVIPVFIIALIARYCLKMNFLRICGLIAGGTTDVAALAFAQEMYGSDHIAVEYTTVYPLTMFLRVLVAQMLIILAL